MKFELVFYIVGSLSDTNDTFTFEVGAAFGKAFSMLGKLS